MIGYTEIKGFPEYSINKEGKVFSNKRRGKVLSPYKVAGYFAVSLLNDGVREIKHIHRILAETFIPNPLCKPCVNHIDGNKLNNSLENLEWSTYKENIRHAWNTGLVKRKKGRSHNYKLSDDDVSFILKNRNKLTQTELADKFNTTTSTISNVLNNKSYSHLNKHSILPLFRDNAKLLFDDSNGVFYYSMKEYAELNDTNPITVASRMNGKGRVSINLVLV